MTEYSELFVTKWHDSQPRPQFGTPVYFYGYDGTNYAYECVGGIEAFLFWVVGIIHETTAHFQDDGEPDDLFLDNVGVNYGSWTATQGQ